MRVFLKYFDTICIIAGIVVLALGIYQENLLLILLGVFLLALGGIILIYLSASKADANDSREGDGVIAGFFKALSDLF